MPLFFRPAIILSTQSLPRNNEPECPLHLRSYAEVTGENPSHGSCLAVTTVLRESTDGPLAAAAAWVESKDDDVFLRDDGRRTCLGAS